LDMKESNKETILDQILTNTLYNYKGITISELSAKLNMSTFTIKNGINELKNKKLLLVEKRSKALCYSFDLNELEKIKNKK
ncbi:MAG: HTH domain-containing protein, partial [Clostridia bacterium]|nr:HTH domain-containing protein [Clostridia bacterium]